MEETQNLLRDLNHDTGELRSAVTVLSTSVRQSRKLARRVAIVATVTMLLTITVGYFASRLQANQTCIKNWANATSARSSSLSTLSTARFAALDKLLRDASPAPDPKQIQADYQAYLKASDAYNAAAKHTPVSQLSSFNCSLL